MSVRAILLYPFKAGSTFNINYYISTHMPSVAKLYGPYGLFSGDETSPYIVQTVLFWDNLDQLNAANSSDGAKYLREDIKNFSSVMPVALVGNIAGQS
ncbi:hypothetical protein E4T38_08078 [Aureobasidium subglaciale]|nr:hypothetical protein E4T38_08078 [Aureobasidium subglaciale]KAI5216189.1 hypothetical protein E4T40_08088 [Aureobasidium subglaciale]KAI5219428.1 hypothetical protein E4T41_08003 [Aureobasidium subglaciale]KAI5256874.1 hypothetical protein E4T46_07979 [Aureobasidium subglaciale]